jgi:hypothetical protein
MTAGDILRAMNGGVLSLNQDSADRPPSVAVMEAIARQKGVSETELPERLADVLDPWALDALFDGKSSTGSVRLEFCECQVRLTHDGTVTVEEEGD